MLHWLKDSHMEETGKTVADCSCCNQTLSGEACPENLLLDYKDYGKWCQHKCLNYAKKSFVKLNLEWNRIFIFALKHHGTKKDFVASLVNIVIENCNPLPLCSKSVFERYIHHFFTCRVYHHLKQLNDRNKENKNVKGKKSQTEEKLERIQHT